MGNSTQPFEIYGALDPVGSPKYKRINLYSNRDMDLRSCRGILWHEYCVIAKETVQPERYVIELE